MSESLKTVITRMASDAAFASRVRDDADGVAAEFGLDPAQVVALAGTKVDTDTRTHRRLEERLSRSALVFGGDMGTDGGVDPGDAGSGGSDDSSSSSSGSSSAGGSSGTDSSDGASAGRDPASSGTDGDADTERSERTGSDGAGRTDSGAGGTSGTQVSGTAPAGTSTTDGTGDASAAAGTPDASTPPPSGTQQAVDPTAVEPHGAADGGYDPGFTRETLPEVDDDPGNTGVFGDPDVFDALFGDRDDGSDAEYPAEDAENVAEAAGNIADSGVAGPVMAPSSVAAPSSPLGYPQSGNDPNGNYHGGPLREHTVGRTPSGGLINEVTYADGTVSEVRVDIHRGPGGEVVVAHESQDDGTISVTTTSDGASTSTIAEPDGTTIVRDTDGVSRLAEQIITNDGGSQVVEWNGESTDPVEGTGLFTVDRHDPDENLTSTTVVSATQDGGAVATTVDATGRSVTARLDVSEIDNDDGSTSRVYRFPDGSTETFTFGEAGAPISHEGHDPVGGHGDRPPLQAPVPAAEGHHGGVVGEQVQDTLPDGRTVHLVSYADGTEVELARAVSADGVVTDTWDQADGTRTLHSYGLGTSSTLETAPDGTVTSTNADAGTMRVREMHPDGNTVATDWTAIGDRQAPGQELFTVRGTALDGTLGESTVVTATTDGGARALVVAADGSTQTVRLGVDEVQNIDGSTTRIYAFPDGRTEAFVFNSDGSPVGHEAHAAPGIMVDPEAGPGQGLLPGEFDIRGPDGDPVAEDGSEPFVESSVDEDGTRITTTTRPDGTMTGVAVRPDGSSSVSTVDSSGRAVLVDTDADGTVSRIVRPPDGSHVAETMTVDGTRAVTAVDADGRSASDQVFPDGSRSSTVHDPSTGITTERIVYADGGTTVSRIGPDGSVQSESRLADGATQTARLEPNGDSSSTTFLPPVPGDVEFAEHDAATGESIVTRNAASGFTSTDRAGPPDFVVTRSSGFPGGSTTVETFGPTGEVVSRVVLDPDGVPVPGSDTAVPPLGGEPSAPLDIVAADAPAGAVDPLFNGDMVTDPGVLDPALVTDIFGGSGVLDTDPDDVGGLAPDQQNWTAMFDESWGVGGTLGGSTEWGPFTADGRLTGYVGAEVGGFATGSIGPDGLSGRVGIGASFGASGSAAGTVGFGLGSIGGGVTASVDGHAAVAGEGSIGLGGISAGIEGDAYVGAMTGGSAAAEALGIGATAGGQLGVGLGVSLDADASLSTDNIGFNLEVGAMLGIGGSYNLGLSVNPEAIVDGIGDIVTDPVGAVEDLADGAYSTAEDVVGTVVDVGEFAGDVVTDAPEVVGDAVEAVGDVAEAVFGIADNAAEAVGGVVDDAVGAIGDAAGAAVEFFDSLF